MSVADYIQRVVSHPNFFQYKTNMMEEGRELFPVIKEAMIKVKPQDHIEIFIPFEVIVVDSTHSTHGVKIDFAQLAGKQ